MNTRWHQARQTLLDSMLQQDGQLQVLPQVLFSMYAQGCVLPLTSELIVSGLGGLGTTANRIDMDMQTMGKLRLGNTCSITWLARVMPTRQRNELNKLHCPHKHHEVRLQSILVGNTTRLRCGTMQHGAVATCAQTSHMHGDAQWQQEQSNTLCIP
jgi:hypothetical protein